VKPLKNDGATTLAGGLDRSRQSASAEAAVSLRPADAGLQVVHFHRRPFAGQHSIEQLFANLRKKMREMGADVVPAVAPFCSKGLVRRIANVAWSALHQRTINHVTGDVHFLVLGLSGPRTILTIHDCHALERLTGWRRKILKLFWFDLPIRRAAMVTVISEETKRQLLRHLDAPPERFTVIPNAVGSIFRPYPKAFNTVRPRVLQVGSMPNKNLPRLVRALQGLSCHLSIVGILNDEQRDMLDQARINYDARSDLDEAGMYQAYCEADIVSFVSTYEGFGLPIIEAQWVERPVITSNCSSMPDVAGNGACLVDPFDVASIRTGFERVIQDAAYREYMLEAGRENRVRFSLDEVARRYIEIYRRVAQPDAAK
jgi:glycosyltransferase involved in cell wall biosynthesis